jgi:glycosyltransferase involved in cell wall biosynthesis
MKILYGTYPWAFDTPGGGEIQLLKYKEFIKSNDIDIDLFNQWDPKFLEYDLIHYFSSMAGSVHFINYMKKLGLPVLISPNLWITKETASQYNIDEIRTGFVLADFIICNSNAECDMLSMALNMPRGKFLTVYNGIDEIFFKKTSPSLFIHEYGITDKFILNVANIEPRKNQLNLIKAMKKYPDLKLVVIGGIRDKKYFNACQHVAQDQLIYIGKLSHESELLRSAYNACEAFVLPSTVETPGLAALEAAVSGAKILITAEGSTYEYFKDSVRYVDHTSIQSIENGLQEILKENKNDLLVHGLKEHYSWSHVVSQLENIYKQIFNINRLRNNSDSFYEFDSHDNNIHIWTKEEVDFEIENCKLSFLWWSVSGADVDIYHNGVLSHKDIRVGSNLASFSINIHNDSNAMNNVKMVVKNIDINKQPRADRILGVNIRNVSIVQP